MQGRRTLGRQFIWLELPLSAGRVPPLVQRRTIPVYRRRSGVRVERFDSAALGPSSHQPPSTASWEDDGRCGAGNLPAQQLARAVDDPVVVRFGNAIIAMISKLMGRGPHRPPYARISALGGGMGRLK